ncbi:MAG: GIY-YIG nuclease family protein [Gemmatimonadota bacterium]
MATYYTYILATRSRSLDFGVTSNLQRRVGRHRAMEPNRSLGKDGAVRLVYYEQRTSVEAALERVREIQRWSYPQVEALISRSNPNWHDLAMEWFVARRA